MFYTLWMCKETVYIDITTISPFLTSFFWTPPKIPSKVSTKPTALHDHLVYRHLSQLLNWDLLRVRSCTVESSIRANRLPTHPTYHLLARNGNLDKEVAVHVFVVTKGTKHGLCTLSKVEKGASPSWVSWKQGWASRWGPWRGLWHGRNPGTPCSTI